MDENDFQARAAVYNKAFQVFGYNNQLVVAIEEMSELQKEACKALRGNGNVWHLAEEVADAIIMLEQLQLMYGIEAEVLRIMGAKVARLSSRIAEEEKGKEHCELWLNGKAF